MPAELELNIAVCDNELLDRTQITCMTKEILHDVGISHNIETFESANTLLSAIQGGARFHILILDVMMDEMNGIELASFLRKQDNKTSIIFISSNLEMALCGYEVAAARYLAKPLKSDKLKEALMYCYQCWQEKKEILLQTNQGKHRTSFSDIYFAEAFERGTKFFLENEIVETKLKFSEAESMLPKSIFILCHRAYIVNINCIKRIRPYEFEMRSGAHVPISKHRYYEINKRFIDYIMN